MSGFKVKSSLKLALGAEIKSVLFIWLDDCFTGTESEDATGIIVDAKQRKVINSSNPVPVAAAALISARNGLIP